MEVRTVHVSTAFLFRALLQLIVKWVVIVFLPPVTILTRSLKHATFFVLANESACLPICTQHQCIIIEQIGLSPEVLPVVSVVTLGLIVLLVERAPLSLEVEHIEVGIFLHKVNDPCLNVPHRVCKGAVFAVLTVVEVLWEFGAKLGLVFFNVVQPLNPIVSKLASFLKCTLFSLCVLAKIWTVVSMLPSLVFHRVEESAVLMVVLVLYGTGVDLELV